MRLPYTEDLHKDGRGNLWFQRMGIESADWVDWYEDDILIVHNPRYRTCSKEPVKIPLTLAIICEGGEALGSVNLKPYRLKRNSFMIVLSGHIMESRNVSSDFKATYIFMSERFLSRLEIGDSYKFYESVEREPLMQFDEETAEALQSYVSMTKAMFRIKDRNPNTGEGIRLLTKLFFMMMGWFIHHGAATRDSAPRPSEVTGDFLALVKKHYAKHRDVEFYAGKMNMTAKYMSSLVKKASGKGALQWIEDYVILDAKARLSSSADSIQEISYSLNFPTQSFFGRYFKRAVGMSPAEYRRSAQLISSAQD